MGEFAMSQKTKVNHFFQSFKIIFFFSIIIALISCGGGSTANDTQQKIETIVTTSGGIVEWELAENSNIKTTLTIPPDALNTDTTISVQKSDVSVDEISFLQGTVLDFGPDGLSFDSVAKLEMNYDVDLLNGAAEDKLSIYRISNGVWEKVASVLDATTHTLTAEINGFSAFGIGFIKIPVLDIFTVSGTVDGMTGGTLELQLNNTEYLTITANGDFNFNMFQHNGWVYEVVISNQPENQLCTVSNGEGIVTTSNITDVSISCVNNAFTVSGSVSGMTGGTLDLQLNHSDDLAITDNGSFEFAQLQYPDWVYEVLIINQPENQLCTVSNGGGMVRTSHITDVSISCVNNAFTVSGSVSGMTGGTLDLQLNNTEDLAITANGDFIFDMLQQPGWVYEVLIINQPENQLCTVGNGGGMVRTSHITDVSISCVNNAFTVSGSVSGLTAGTLDLQLNNTEDLAITANGDFKFIMLQQPGWVYEVLIINQPENQLCTVSNGAGTARTHHITDVNISCVNNAFTVSGLVSGLVSGNTLDVRLNNVENLTISSNSSFGFALLHESGWNYKVNIVNQPLGQLCTVNNGSGTIALSNVTNVSINCEVVTGWVHPANENSYINPEGAGGNVVMAMNNNGQAIAAWTAFDGSTDCGASADRQCSQVYISQYQNGNWTSVPSLSSNISPDGFNAFRVQVAISDNGDAVVVWQMNTAWPSLCNNVTFQCSRIFMSEYRNGSWTHPADMNDFIDPSNVNNVSLAPKVAMDSSGNTIIVWRNFAGGVYKSEYRNGAWIHPLNINDDIPISYWNPTVAMDDNGNALIVWQGDDSNYHDRIYLSEYRNGTWSHATDLETDAINPPGQGSCPGITCPIPVKIAMDNNGNAIIVWDQRTSSYADYEDGAIYKSEYRNGVWSHPANVDDTINPDGNMTDWARFPEVAMDDNNNAIIVWRQNDDTEDCDIVPPTYYASRPAPCKQMFISEYRDGSWTYPINKSDHISVPGQPVRTSSSYQSYSVAMGNNGEAIVSWSQFIPSEICNGIDDKQVYVSTYRDGGWQHPASLDDNLIELGFSSYSPLAFMDNEGTVLMNWNSLNNVYFSEYRCPECSQTLPQIIAPRNLQAIPADGQVHLSWHEVSDAHSYNIYWSETGVATTSDNKISSVTGGTYQHIDRTNKTTYSYLVTAVIPGVESLPSENASATPSACIGCEPILAQTLLSGSSSTDEGKAIAFDSSGSVFVTGYTWGDMDGNTSNGSSDIFISKYIDGNRVWTVQPGTSGYEAGNGIAVDSDGNIYVAGQGFLLSKYNTVGALQWSVPTTFEIAEGNGIALDPAGNIYITGWTSVDLDGDGENTYKGGIDIFISKYNSDGVLQWIVQPGTTENDAGNSIAVDAQGNVYVTGVTNSGLDGNTADGYEDVFITKYSTDGTRLWTEQIDPTPGPSNTYREVGKGIALDTNNNIYVTGETSGKFFESNQRGHRDVFVIKYDTDGCKQWSRQRGVSGTFTFGYGIAVDTNANVYITGETQGELDGNTYNGEQDIFIMKFSTKGVYDWTLQYGEANQDFGNAIAVDANDNIFTTGATDGDLEGQPSNGDGSAYSYDAFLMKHTQN